MLETIFNAALLQQRGNGTLYVTVDGCCHNVVNSGNSVASFWVTFENLQLVATTLI